MKEITLEQLVQVYAFSHNDVLEKADAIIYLEGDSLARVTRCVELFKKGYAPLIVISGTDNRPHLGCHPAEAVAKEMIKSGVPGRNLILENKSINTRDQAVEVLNIAREGGWQKLILVTSLYHQPRAYLTFIGTMEELGVRLKIINDPVRGLPWFERTPRGTRFDIIRGEIKKINLYLGKGHLANWHSILAYERWKQGAKPLKILAAVQVRMGSKRLPDKALRPLAGKTVLERVVERLKQANELEQVIIATSQHPKDNVLAEAAEALDVACYRGPENDLVARLLGAASEFEADAVLRITGDSPLIDPAWVDHGIQEFRKGFGSISLVTTCPPSSFPEGLNFEIISRETLGYLDKTLTDPVDREAFIIHLITRPRQFPRRVVSYGEDRTSVRLTLDYPEDFLLIEQIYNYFLKQGQDFFGLDKILCFLDSQPGMININQHRIDRSKYPYSFGPEAIRKSL